MKKLILTLLLIVPRIIGPAPPAPDIKIVESIPEGTSLDNPEIRDTREVWLEMIGEARKTLDLEEYYISNEPGNMRPASMGRRSSQHPVIQHKEGGKMLKISTMFWFDSQAEEAAKFYASIFEHSGIGKRTFYGKAGFEFHGQPEGKLMTIEFDLEGQRFVGLNGGPIFRFTPAISFLIACGSEKEVDAFWEPLSAGGTALMELGEYPFSKKYGWTRDRYGLSWQVMFMGNLPTAQKITPTLMYVGDVCGKAEEAIRFYASVFSRAKVGDILRYVKNEEPDREGTIKHAGFTLEGREFAAMDSAWAHGFTFTEAISFVVSCEGQGEIDHYWNELTEGGDPNAQQCGWLKDRYGVSWQVTPAVLEKMLSDPDKNKVERVTNAFLRMKKFDIADLEKAYAGR